METTNLGDVAANIAIKGAIEHIRTHGLKADPAALSECLRAMVKIRLPAAMHDAGEAIKANMPRVAEQTFAASMMLAGIEAAKEAAFPA